MITELQAHAVEDSWQMAVPIADRLAALFYAKLFDAEPELRPLFGHASMADQGRRLVAALNLIVRSIDALETIEPALESLGAKHVLYGVRDEHYLRVGETLLATLAEALEGQFSADARDGWAEAIGVVASIMIEAGHRQAVAA